MTTETTTQTKLQKTIASLRDIADALESSDHDWSAPWIVELSQHGNRDDVREMVRLFGYKEFNSYDWGAVVYSGHPDCNMRSFITNDQFAQVGFVKTPLMETVEQMLGLA